MKPEFNKLKKKIFIHVVGIILISLALGVAIKLVLIDGILQKPFADLFIDFCAMFLGMDWYEAVAVYDLLFRHQKSLVLTLGLLVLVSIIFYYSLSRMTRYFKDVIDGIDQLLVSSTEDIHLSPELDFMEKKLNSVKHTLIKREHDARAAEQRKNELVVYLAHDIRTPLTSVIGYLNLLDETEDMPEQQRREYLKITLENTGRLEQLLNEFFDITRFNLQTIQLSCSSFHLTHMLYQIADEFYPIFHEKESEIVIQAEDDLVISADADKLARVFRNILRNASVFSDRHTDITISAKRNGKTVEIQFHNMGAVIPRQQLEAIFEKFYRLDNSRSTQTGGAGLGLAIAKEIVSAHNGTISADSGEAGTTFTVNLPIVLSTL